MTSKEVVAHLFKTRGETTPAQNSCVFFLAFCRIWPCTANLASKDHCCGDTCEVKSWHNSSPREAREKLWRPCHGTESRTIRFREFRAICPSTPLFLLAAPPPKKKNKPDGSLVTPVRYQKCSKQQLGKLVQVSLTRQTNMADVVEWGAPDLFEIVVDSRLLTLLVLLDSILPSIARVTSQSATR